MTLLRQLKEAKHDCETLSKLLEDQEQSLHIEDRERLLLDSEKRLQQVKESISVDQEKLRRLIDSNTQLQLELDEKRELNEKAVEKSVNKILE